MQKYKRYIFIGDVHGCFTELLELLDKAKYNQTEDKIIFVGDLINRGPYSKDCFDFLLNNSATSVLGNHEHGLLEAYNENKDWDILHQMRFEFKEQFEKLIANIKTWPLWLELNLDGDEYLVVHAGISPDLTLASTSPHFLLNVREVKDNQNKQIPWFDLYSGKKIVVFGHWSRLGGVVKSNVIGLDMSCVYGGKLRAYIWPKKEIVEVSAHKAYYIPKTL